MTIIRLAAALAVVTALAPVPVRATITAANVGTLHQKWVLGDTSNVTGDPVIVGDRLYVPAWNSQLYALDRKTGAVQWQQDAGGPLAGPPLPVDDGAGVCVGTLFNGKVTCFNAADGSVRWQRDLSEPAPGSIWSGLATANGRLFVSVASPADQPCTRGRLVALDLATGDEDWRFYTVPDKVCDTDTATTCTQDSDCPQVAMPACTDPNDQATCLGSGKCIKGIGGGVTATVALDPTGTSIYMAAVGCYTSPSIGESDSVFKIDAATGNVAWRHRVNLPEQFGYCVNDSSVDCGMDSHCAGVGGVCRKKGFYHDFGFVNGPLRIEVPAEGGGTQVLITAGSKNGTLYAFDEATGAYVWRNPVMWNPVSPGFAGYGLFNGAVNYADGRLFAALYYMFLTPECSNGLGVTSCSNDGQCGGGTCLAVPPEPPHLMAFDATTGATVWSEEIGRSWSHVAVVNGLVYAGTQDKADDDTSNLFVHDAATGTRVATLKLPGTSVARTAVADDAIYAAYSNGVVAFTLCGNGVVDPGEACDDGNDVAGDCCSPSCTLETGTCDDGDACSESDHCDGATCTGSMTSVTAVDCAAARLTSSPCGDETLPKGLSTSANKTVQAIQHLLDRAHLAAGQGKTAKVAKLRKAALKALDALGKRIDKAARSKKADRNISATCRTSFDALLSAQHGFVTNVSF